MPIYQFTIRDKSTRPADIVQRERSDSAQDLYKDLVYRAAKYQDMVGAQITKDAWAKVDRIIHRKTCLRLYGHHTTEFGVRIGDIHIGYKYIEKVR